MIKLLNILEDTYSYYHIYCDMDGVLVNFDEGYKKLTGEFPSGVNSNQLPADFWEPISKAGISFWARLKWMPDGKALWQYIKQYKPKVLSAPSREESSRIGKRVWMKRELPNVELLLRYADQKQELSTPHSILIDDREKSIKQWKDRGGIGILHTSAANTIKQLKQIGL